MDLRQRLVPLAWAVIHSATMLALAIILLALAIAYGSYVSMVNTSALNTAIAALPQAVSDAIAKIGAGSTGDDTQAQTDVDAATTAVNSAITSLQGAVTPAPSAGTQTFS